MAKPLGLLEFLLVPTRSERIVYLRVRPISGHSTPFVSEPFAQLSTNPFRLSPLFPSAPSRHLNFFSVMTDLFLHLPLTTTRLLRYITTFFFVRIYPAFDWGFMTLTTGQFCLAD